ncbi:MAG: hypothetical protein Q4D95_04575 [Peptoniphilus sp.]|nr:hypothetical protein [Peptoniphilus sp.]
MNILLIDDGLGSVEFMRKLAEGGMGGDLLIDNKNYPYALRERSILALSIKLLNRFKAENYIVTNPAIAVNLQNSNRKIIDGLEKFYALAGEGALVLTNRYFARHLKGEKGVKAVDAQVLSNQVQFFDIKEYILANILDYYLEGHEEVFFMDSNLYVLKDFVLKRYKGKKIHFLQDFIMDELEALKVKGNSKGEIFVTMDRRSVYLNLEDTYAESFWKVKNTAL